MSKNTHLPWIPTMAATKGDMSVALWAETRELEAALAVSREEQNALQKKLEVLLKRGFNEETDDPATINHMKKEIANHQKAGAELRTKLEEMQASLKKVAADKAKEMNKQKRAQEMAALKDDQKDLLQEKVLGPAKDKVNESEDNIEQALCNFRCKVFLSLEAFSGVLLPLQFCHGNNLQWR